MPQLTAEQEARANRIRAAGHKAAERAYWAMKRGDNMMALMWIDNTHADQMGELIPTV